MTGLLFVVALLAQPAPAARTLKVRVLYGEKPAPLDTEVRLFLPSPLCGTAQRRGAPLRTPDKDGWVVFENVSETGSIRAEHPWLGSVGLLAEGAGPFTLRFPTGAPIAGRVLDAKGNPMLRARVVVVSREYELVHGEIPALRLEAVSSVDGSFRFANLRPGKWAVLADAFDDVWSAGVEVMTGNEKAEVKLPVRAWLTGRVLDGLGRPLADPWLHVQTVSGGSVMSQISQPTTAAEYEALLKPAIDPPNYLKAFGGGADGRFETFVPTSVPIEVWADGPAEACSTSKRVRVKADQPVELRLPAPASVKLKVLAKGGKPLPRATLLFTAMDDCSARTVQAETTEGLIIREEVPIAYTRVEVRAPLHQPVEKKLALVPGKQLDLGIIQLTPGARLVGRVLDADGKPMNYAEVWVGLKEVARTEKDGRFEADGMAPGKASIKAKYFDDRQSQPKVMTLNVGEENSIELILK